MTNDKLSGRNQNDKFSLFKISNETVSPASMWEINKVCRLAVAPHIVRRLDPEAGFCQQVHGTVPGGVAVGQQTGPGGGSGGGDIDGGGGGGGGGGGDGSYSDGDGGDGSDSDGGGNGSDGDGGGGNGGDSNGGGEGDGDVSDGDGDAECF